MASHHISKLAAGLLASVVVVSRSATSILTPLWIDGLNNNTGNRSCDLDTSEHRIDPYTTMFIINVLYILLMGTVVLGTKCFCRTLLTEADDSYPKWQFAVIGVSDMVAGVCFVYASSGCRTAPYLQSLVGNFSVPVTFVVRFLILRKRPTRRKAACAVAILLAEFIALIPSIFPQSAEARKHAGGAEGVAGVLWPLCFLLGYIPLAMVSTVMEKAVKSRDHGGGGARSDLNIAYMLFWTYVFNQISLICLFWTDMIPGFGMTTGPTEFVHVFWFNIKCYFGFEGCHGAIIVYAVLCTVLLVILKLSNSYFLRYLEGANYLVIVSTIQTPVVFLFFTVFDENPLKWHPHAYLSTWLSIAAICIMLPALYIYDTGAPEVTRCVTGVTTNYDLQESDTDDLPTPYSPLLQQEQDRVYVYGAMAESQD